MPEPGSVFITLGDTVHLSITAQGNLHLTKSKFLHELQSIDLGRATEKRFNDIIEYIERLKIHAVPE